MKRPGTNSSYLICFFYSTTDLKIWRRARVLAANAFFIPHLKIRSVARVLAVDHVEATILGVGGLGGVQVDAKDERQLARDDLGVGRAQLGEKCLCLYVCMFMFMFRPSWDREGV